METEKVADSTQHSMDTDKAIDPVPHPSNLNDPPIVNNNTGI